jgi:hypothetical protein
MHFTGRHPQAEKNKYMDPCVASPSSFATLRISPAGSDARKTAQPQGDTLKLSFLEYTDSNAALTLRRLCALRPSGIPYVDLRVRDAAIVSVGLCNPARGLFFTGGGHAPTEFYLRV